jgi:hypothetical protein
VDFLNAMGLDVLVAVNGTSLVELGTPIIGLRLPPGTPG